MFDIYTGVGFVAYERRLLSGVDVSLVAEVGWSRCNIADDLDHFTADFIELTAASTRQGCARLHVYYSAHDNYRPIPCKRIDCAIV